MHGPADRAPLAAHVSPMRHRAELPARKHATKRAARGASGPRDSGSLTLHSAVAAAIVLILTGRLHDALANGVVPAAKILLGVGALAVLFGRGIAGIRQAWRTLPMRSFAVLTIAVFVSLPFSYLRSLSLQAFITWVTVAVPIVLVVSSSVHSAKDLERLLRALLLVVVCSGLLVVLGRGVVLQTIDGPRFTLAGSYDPNDFASVVATCTAACVWALRDRSRIWRMLGLAGFALSVLVLAKTASRGGFVSLSVMLVVGALFIRGLLPKWLALSLIPAAIIGLTFAPDELTSRLSTLTNVTEDYNFTDPGGRVQVWKRGLGYVLARPVTGVGARAFPIAEGRWAVQHGYLSGFKWTAAHNIIVECAAELGLIGVTALLTCLLSSVFLFVQINNMPQDSDERIRIRRAVGAVALTTITFLIGAMFVSAFWNPLVEMIIALNIAAHALVARRQPATGHAFTR